jgi:DNA-binding response OmpR family regulator
MLVDDDEPDTLFTYKTFLLSEGYAVSALTDSKEALEHFAEMNSYNYYNLVVMDIRMPGLNGLQSHYRLNAMNKAIKFLSVSALDSIEELVGVLSSINYNKILTKLVKKEYFINKIKIFQKIILGFDFNTYFIIQLKLTLKPIKTSRNLLKVIIKA